MNWYKRPGIPWSYPAMLVENVQAYDYQYRRHVLDCPESGDRYEFTWTSLTHIYTKEKQNGYA